MADETCPKCSSKLSVYTLSTNDKLPGYRHYSDVARLLVLVCASCRWWAPCNKDKADKIKQVGETQ